jgi:hypothetical protein
MLTQARLKELFAYDPLIGKFVRRERRGSARAGEIAGTDNGCGYLQIAVDRRVYVAHRMAWLYVNGTWPANQIDHVNGKRADNRISNLRLATSSENQCNTPRYKNTSTGVKGVCYHKRWKKFQAHIQINKKKAFLGYFHDLASAAAAYADAAAKLHGDFANCGSVKNQY